MFIKYHNEEIPVPRILISNSATVNILHVHIMKKFGKIQNDLIPIDIMVNNFIRGAIDT